MHFDSAYIDGRSIPLTHAGYFPYLGTAVMGNGFFEFGEQILLDLSGEDLKKFSEMKTVRIKVANAKFDSSERVFAFPVSGGYFLGFLQALEREGIDMTPRQITNKRQEKE